MKLDFLEKFIEEFIRKYREKFLALRYYEKAKGFLERVSYGVNIVMNENVEEFIIENHFNTFWLVSSSMIRCRDFRDLINDSNCSEFLEFHWHSLSSGESALLMLFQRLYAIKDSFYHKNALLLIDEGELFMHPQWQKQYLNYITQFISQNFKETKFQIILTSHSPFIVSDLPKENVIFLKKKRDAQDNEIGEMEVVKGVEKQNTFGANIHTLFADAFFMKGGLIGEFAKGKINEILEVLHPIITFRRLTHKKENVELTQFVDWVTIHKPDDFEYLMGLLSDDTHFKTKRENLSSKYGEDELKLGFYGDIALDNSEKEEKLKALKGRIQLNRSHIEVYNEKFQKFKKVVDSAKDAEKENNEFKQLIDKIGDPIVQTKLYELYAEAEALLDPEKKESSIQREIEMLKARQEQLEKLLDKAKNKK